MDWVSLVSRAMEIHISLLPSYGDFGLTDFAHLKWKEMSQFGQMCRTKISNEYDCTLSKACQSHAFEVRSTRLNSWEVRPKVISSALMLHMHQGSESFLAVNSLGALGCVPNSRMQ